MLLVLYLGIFWAILNGILLLISVSGWLLLAYIETKLSFICWSYVLQPWYFVLDPQADYCLVSSMWKSHTTHPCICYRCSARLPPALLGPWLVPGFWLCSGCCSSCKTLSFPLCRLQAQSPCRGNTSPKPLTIFLDSSDLHWALPLWPSAFIISSIHAITYMSSDCLQVIVFCVQTLENKLVEDKGFVLLFVAHTRCSGRK